MKAKWKKRSKERRQIVVLFADKTKLLRVKGTALRYESFNIWPLALRFTLELHITTVDAYYILYFTKRLLIDMLPKYLMGYYLMGHLITYLIGCVIFDGPSKIKDDPSKKNLIAISSLQNIFILSFTISLVTID